MFCENCFQTEEIKQYIKNNGKTMNKQFICSFCGFQNYDQIDIDDCIQEYIDKCIEDTQEIIPEEKYENKELSYINKCENKCQKKYKQTCIDKNLVKTYVIEKNILIKHAKHIIQKLYEHEDGHGLYGSANTLYWTEEVDNPCTIAGLLSTDDVCEHIFSEDAEKIAELINENCDFYECPWLCRCFDKDETNRFGKWSEFCINVKHKARFFDHNDFKVKEYLDKFIAFFNIVENLNYPKKAYRARIIYDDKTKQAIKQDNEKELGKIPVDKLKHTKSNRFSPIGISYGYYSFDIQTILSEVRANKNENVAVGIFQLEENLKILDFRAKNLSKYINPFYDDFNIDVYCGEEFILNFLHDISKPISEDESILEYVPTQILSEYIWSLGYDGFIFDSSQKKGRENLVLFGDNPKCIKHCFFNIKEKNINYIIEQET